VNTWLRTNCRKIERWRGDRRKALWWQRWTVLTHTIILKWIWETWKNKTCIAANYVYSFPHTHNMCVNIIDDNCLMDGKYGHSPPKTKCVVSWHFTTDSVISMQAGQWATFHCIYTFNP